MMHAKHEGRKWVVRDRHHVFGRHKRKGEALTQEGAIHLHIRQAKGSKGKKGGFLVSVFAPPKRKKRSKRKGKR